MGLILWICHIEMDYCSGMIADSLEQSFLICPWEVSHFVSVIKHSFICIYICIWTYICIYTHLKWVYIKIISLLLVCGHMRKNSNETRIRTQVCWCSVSFSEHICLLCIFFIVSSAFIHCWCERSSLYYSQQHGEPANMLQGYWTLQICISMSNCNS